MHGFLFNPTLRRAVTLLASSTVCTAFHFYELRIHFTRLVKANAVWRKTNAWLPINPILRRTVALLASSTVCLVQLSISMSLEYTLQDE